MRSILRRLFGTRQQAHAARRPTHERIRERPQPASKHAFTLDRHWEGNGRGLIVVRSADRQRLSWRTLPRGEGLESVNAVGVSHRLEALQDDSFAVGRKLSLVREPDNEYDPNAIGVWNADRSLMVGYIPREEAGRLAKKLDRGEPWECYSMWTVKEGGERVALRLLLCHEKADLDRALLN